MKLWEPKPSLKIGTANSICWRSLGLFRDYDLNHIFFRNKTVLFFKIESWNLQHLFKREFCETSQNFSSFEQLVFPIEEYRLNELKFCKDSRNPKSNRCWKFQRSILTHKTVLFLKKIWSGSVPCTMDSSANRCRIVSQLSKYIWHCSRPPVDKY